MFFDNRFHDARTHKHRHAQGHWQGACLLAAAAFGTAGTCDQTAHILLLVLTAGLLQQEVVLAVEMEKLHLCRLSTLLLILRT